jgi:zinc protease
VDIESWETEQGMRVLFAPAPTLPMLDIRLTFDAGAARDGDRNGLARLTSNALAHGTADMDADAVAERFEAVGAQFNTTSARDMGIVTLRTSDRARLDGRGRRCADGDPGGPAFPEDDLARERRQMLQALQRERQEPGSVASRRFYQLMYGEHPYGNAPSGSEDTIPTLTRAEVESFFRQYYTAGNAVLSADRGDLARGGRGAGRSGSRGAPRGRAGAGVAAGAESSRGRSRSGSPFPRSRRTSSWAPRRCAATTPTITP